MRIMMAPSLSLSSAKRLRNVNVQDSSKTGERAKYS